MDEIFQSAKRRRQIITLLRAVGIIVSMMVLVSSLMIAFKSNLKFMYSFYIHLIPLFVVAFYVLSNNKLFADHIKES